VDRYWNREFLTCIKAVVVLIALVASRISVCLAQEGKDRDPNPPFLEERGSPLKAIRTGGSVVVVRNVSNKQILNWAEMCLARSGNGYKVLEVFTLDLDMRSALKPGDVQGDSFHIDAEPTVICAARGGILAISEVQFVDGSRWKSRWLNAAPPKVPSDQK
jgi:hypothetical protein